MKAAQSGKEGAKAAASTRPPTNEPLKPQFHEIAGPERIHCGDYLC